MKTLLHFRASIRDSRLGITILDQADELRGTGDLLSTDYLRIRSVQFPEFRGNILFVRGTKREKDTVEAIRNFETTIAAQAYLLAILDALRGGQFGKFKTRLRSLDNITVTDRIISRMLVASKENRQEALAELSNLLGELAEGDEIVTSLPKAGEFILEGE